MLKTVPPDDLNSIFDPDTSNDPVIWTFPVWLNGPILVKVPLPDTVNEPVIVVSPNQPVSIEEPALIPES